METLPTPIMDRPGPPAELPGALHADLVRCLDPSRVLARLIDRVAHASDASFYRKIPRAVVRPASISEIRSLFRLSRAHRIPLTFRAAGTSLSGQAVTDGILVDVSRHFRGIRVESDGRWVRVEPGAIGGHVNRLLAPHGRRLGPDPASIDSCMMGGILANNASGMCCGIEANAYRTLREMKLVLPDGTCLDSGSPAGRHDLAERAPGLAAGLEELRQHVAHRPALGRRIRDKYRIKNTMGYALNALIDHRDPMDILIHLMIGSEGTLGFIAEAVLETVPDPRSRVTGWLLFAEVETAVNAIPALKACGATACELLDRASMLSVRSGAGDLLAVDPLPAGATGLLVELAGRSVAERDRRLADLEALAGRLDLLSRARITVDPDEQARLWKLRKGLFPAIGATRRRGTSVIIEDVAFREERLAGAILDLQRLFRTHGYDEAILFGHARDGNLHFVLAEDFGDGERVDRYRLFMQDLADLVVNRHDGSLKAEHGTGRNMAPFVAIEWGPDGLDLMRRVKALFDPEGLLNPGVILNEDPMAHVRDLKDLPVIEEVADRCIECGFCEPVCPSRDLTLTPRRRIVVRREMARLSASPAGAVRLAALERDYRYDGLETCAVDGTCALACPVRIDTGALVRRLRAAGHPPGARRRARVLASHPVLVERGLRALLGAGHVIEQLLGEAAVRSLVGVGETMLGTRLPRWIAAMPRPGSRHRPRTERPGCAAVYPTGCITRLLGPPAGDRRPALDDTLVALARRAGRDLWIPDDVAGFCCGLPFRSKGYPEAAAVVLDDAIDRLWRWTDGGRLPVVIDASSCAHALIEAGSLLDDRRRGQWKALRFLDAPAFARDVLVPGLEVRPVRRRVVLHPPCSVVDLGELDTLAAVVRSCAGEVVVPGSHRCCGFAGDRGFLHPELTASATRDEAGEILAAAGDDHVSSNATCEIGLRAATGRPFRSFLDLLEEASRETGLRAAGPGS